MLAGAHRLDALHRGAEALHGGDARDVRHAPRRCGSRSRRAAASRRCGAVRGVDDQVDLAVEDPLRRSSARRRARRPRCACARPWPSTPLRRSTSAVPSVARISKPRSASRLTGKIIARLSRLATETKTVPVGRQRAVGRGLRLGEGRAEVVVDAHHLAGRAHLRAEHGVDGLAVGRAEPVERHHGLLDRDRRVGGQVAAVAVGGSRPSARSSAMRRAEHDPGRGLGQRDGGRLGDERHRAAGPRVGLEHVEHVGSRARTGC